MKNLKVGDYVKQHPEHIVEWASATGPSETHPEFHFKVSEIFINDNGHTHLSAEYKNYHIGGPVSHFVGLDLANHENKGGHTPGPWNWHRRDTRSSLAWFRLQTYSRWNSGRTKF